MPFCVGTPGYVAPEMMERDHYDSKADVFSCGVTLYMLLTHTPPFYAQTKDGIMQKNRDCQPYLNLNNLPWQKNNYDIRTLDLLKKLIAKHPEDRLHAHEALKHPAFDLVEHDKYGTGIRPLKENSSP